MKSAARVCAAVLHNEHAVLSASTLMTGQYGEEGIFTSLPCVIGAEGVEEVVIRKDDLCRLRAALDQLSEEEKSLIRALFFDERSERELEEMMGVHRMTIHNRKIRILQKLKKMLR